MNNISQAHKDIIILAVRVIVGGIFIAAGWMKVSDMAMTVGYFSQMSIPVVLTYVVSYAELIGGILIVLGIWSSCSAAVLSVIMLFAIWFTRGMGFQGMMAPLAVLAGLLSIVASGTGKHAVRFKRRS